MRTLAIVIALATSITASADPKPAPTKVRQAGDAPAISMLDAVAKAKAHAKAKKIDLSRQYLQSAVFDIVERQWSLGWQVPRAKGGHTELVVHEDGKVDVHYGE